MVMSSNKIGRRAMKATQAGIDDILKSAQTSARATVESDMKADDTIKKATAPQKAQSFAEAFKAARADKGAGKTFTFGGKSYSTNKAGEGLKRPTSTPVRASTPKATAPETNTRAQTELSRTAARSQKNIRENRAENQADFRRRMQSKPDAASTSNKSPINAGRTYRSKTMNDLVGLFSGSNAAKNFEKSQKAKGYAKGGSIDGCAVRGKTRAPMKKGK